MIFLKIFDLDIFFNKNTFLKLFFCLICYISQLFSIKNFFNKNKLTKNKLKENH